MVGKMGKTFIRVKKGLIQLYQTYAFYMGWFTYFDTVSPLASLFYPPKDKIYPLKLWLILAFLFAVIFDR